MFKLKLSHFSQEVFTIHPGEYHASGDDIIIATVLGSCVAVALYDTRLCIGGLNHFMLPGGLDDPDIAHSQNAKYGMYAIELLYNEMLKAGSHKADIVAKLFGGASVLNLPGGPTKVPTDNIEFAQTYMRREGIPIVASDLGGVRARKLFFFVKSGKVLLKRFGGTAVQQLEQEEEEYLRVIKRARNGPITLFGRP